MDAASMQWATVEGAADNIDIHENAGDADVVRDTSIDAAAPTSDTDDNEGWGQREVGGPATRAKNTAKAAAHAATAEHIDHDPVPVTVVGPATDVVENVPTDWAPLLLGVGNTPQQVLGRQPSRRTLTLVNVGAVTVYLGPDQSTATSQSGFPLAAGDAIDLSTIGPVVASTDGGGASTLRGVVTYDAGN